MNPITAETNKTLTVARSRNKWHKNESVEKFRQIEALVVKIETAARVHRLTVKLLLRFCALYLSQRFSFFIVPEFPAYFYLFSRRKDFTLVNSLETNS